MTIAQACRGRVRRLRQLIDEVGCDALLITNPVDIRYLTGFHGDASTMIVREDSLTILSDFRFEEELEKLPIRVRVVMREGSMAEAIEAFCKGCDCKAVGFQSEHMSVAVRNDLAKRVGARRLCETTGLMSGLRVVKDELEIRAIRKAIKIQEESFEAVLEEMKPGMREREVCASLEWHMKSMGSEAASFPPIVAAGANGSKPHAVPGSQRLMRGKAVLIDWGATVDGYCSDMTRTMALRAWPKKLAEVYEVVLEAQLEAIKAIAPGKRGREIDAVARGIIDEAGYGPRFGHGLGHGIGLNIHEAPRLSWQFEDELKPGMVVTVEPGIYLPGVGGVRIEDDVLVTQTGRRVLSSLPKDQDWATR